MEVTPQRYAELDWLRVILIVAVFMHHVFMPFNGDNWHIMNSESSKLLDDTMVYFEQLRLPVLFLIAGAGSIILLNRISSKAFLLSKSKRLLLPLLLAMMFITPPQAYFEAPEQYASLLDAYQQRLLIFDNKHLWFIEFLIIFMLLAIPLNKALDTSPGQSLLETFEKLSHRPFGLMLSGVVLVSVRCFLKLYYPEQDGAIENLSVSVFYLVFFITGMLFMSRQAIWQSVARHRRVNLYGFIVSSLVFYIYYLGDFSSIGSLAVRWQIWWALTALLSWIGMLVLLGYAGHYLNNSPAWLRQANELIYPFYILHQTVIVVLAYYIVQWDAGITLKSLSVLVLAFTLTAGLCYFLIRPTTWLRLAFGLKQRA